MVHIVNPLGEEGSGRGGGGRRHIQAVPNVARLVPPFQHDPAKPSALTPYLRTDLIISFATRVDGMITIGQVAKQAGVGVETVRFYERKGLIDQPRRPGSGFRDYPDEVVAKIRFIRHAKDLGFTLSEIGELLSLRAHPRTSCSAVKVRAEQKVADIDERVRSLRRIRRTLVKLAEACDRQETSAKCAILEALE
jgi:MerR family mercuric resistance operon transcriptional regulator